MLRGQKRMLGQVRGGGREVARTLVTLVVVLLAVTRAPVSFAQQQKADAAADSEVLQEVVVTGSLIKRANAETAVPITILKADALKDQGITSVEQALDQLTSSNSVINVTQSVGTFTGGGTYADLRGLGSSRTLVLLDGQRVAPSAFGGAATGNASVVDLSGIIRSPRSKTYRGASDERLVPVWLGRRRGRDQLHHQEEFPGSLIRRYLRQAAKSRRQLERAVRHLWAR